MYSTSLAFSPQFGLSARNWRTGQGVYRLPGQLILLLQAGVTDRANFPMVPFLPPLTSLPSFPLRACSSSLTASIQNTFLCLFRRHRYIHNGRDIIAFIRFLVEDWRSLVEKFACQTRCKIPLETKMALLWNIRPWPDGGFLHIHLEPIVHEGEI